MYYLDGSYKACINHADDDKSGEIGSNEPTAVATVRRSRSIVNTRSEEYTSELQSQ